MNFRDVGLNSCKASGSINERQELSVKGSSFRIDNHPHLRRRRNKLFESLNPFPRYRKFEGPKSAHVATRLSQAGDEALANRIRNVCNTIGIDRVAFLSAIAAGVAPARSTSGFN